LVPKVRAPISGETISSEPKMELLGKSEEMSILVDLSKDE